MKIKLNWFWTIVYILVSIALATFLAMWLLGCSPQSYRSKVIMGNDGHFVSDDHLIGGRIQVSTVGNCICKPYRIDPNDPTIYYECPRGNLQVFFDLEEYYRKR